MPTKLVALTEPIAFEENPEVGLFFREGQGGRMHVMAHGSNGGIRKVFTIYPDGTGYLNKWKGSEIPGLQFDHFGRLVMRDVGGRA